MNDQTWRLKWYYFADLITLVEAPWPDCRGQLILKLLKMPRDKVARILEGENENLLDTIPKLEFIKNRLKYKWSAQSSSNLGVQICDLTRTRMRSVLTPDMIYVHWPFQHPLGEELKKHVGNAFSARPCSAVFDKTPFLISQSLGAIDSLIHLATDRHPPGVYKPPDYLKKFKEAKSTKERREVLEWYAKEALKKGNFKLPKSTKLLIEVGKDMPSYETYLECTEDRKLLIKIGLKLDSSIRIFFERWCDGACDANYT